jgi:hypothetical protein
MSEWCISLCKLAFPKSRIVAQEPFWDLDRSVVWWKIKYYSPVHSCSRKPKVWHHIKRTRNAMIVDRARKGREVVYHYPMYFPRRANYCIATSAAVKISHFGTSRHYNIFLVWLIRSTVDSISTISYLISENDASHSSARRHVDV